MDISIALTIYGLVLIIAILVPFWLDTNRFKATAAASRRFKLTLFSVEIPLSGELLVKLLSYILLLQVLDIVVPRYLSWFVVLVIAARTSSFFFIQSGRTCGRCTGRHDASCEGSG